MRFNLAAISPLILLSCLLFPISYEVLASSVGELRILRSDSQSLLLELTTQVPLLTQREARGQTVTTLSVSGYGYLTEPGKPHLPIWSHLLGIPPKGDIRAEVVDLEWVTAKVGYIPPAGDMSLGDAPWEGFLKPKPDPEIYSRNAFYPPHLVEVYPVGLIRDQRVARLQVFPFQYNPVTGELRTYTRLVVRVDFASPPSISRAIPTSLIFNPFEDLLARTLLNHGEARAWRRPPLRPPRPLFRPSFTSKQYKILVRQEGIYHISYDQLVEAGVNLSGIDPRTIKITNRGREIPIYMWGEGDGSFDPGDYLEFYGEPNLYQGTEEDLFKDPYSDVNVYWLCWGESRGLRLVEESGGIVETNPLLYRQPYSYEFTVHAEEDNTYDRLRWVTTTADHWFWGEVEANRLRSYSLTLPKPDLSSTTPVKVRAMLHGKTYPAAYPDHHVLIYLNNALVADATWDGQTKCFCEPETGIPSSYLQDGTNTLTLVCPGDTPAKEVDIIYFNWVEVEYPRLYQAQDDYIEFTIPKDGPKGLYQFVLGGFSRPEVEIYKKGISKIVDFEVKYIEEEGFYQVTFQDSVLSSEVEYVALTPKRKLIPETIKPDEPSELKSFTNGADYLFITHENFYDNLQTLADFWTTRGLRVQVIKTTDIYDEFNYGIFSPEAIRDFLRYAYYNWDPSPTYVLLVGDGTWDYKDRYGQGGNFVPTYPSYTYKWGRTAADHLYACVSGDDLLPDLFLGRFPVRTNAELEAMIKKTIDYLKAPQLGQWRQDVLMLAGMGETFHTQSEALISDYIPLGYDISRVYIYPGPYHGGTATLLDELEEGAILVNFLGHGGGGIWSDASLLNSADVPEIYNPGKLPFIISLTCFTGAFDEPYWSVLGEELVKTEEKGAVAFFGSNGLGWVNNDYWLNQEIFSSVFKGSPKSLGQTLVEAKIRYFSKYQGTIAESMIKQYNLLGDPALRLGFPRYELEVELNAYRFLAGGQQTITVSASSDSISQGRALVKVVQKDTLIASSHTTIVDGSFSESLSATVDTAGVVRVYVWDESSQRDGMGFAAFDVTDFFFGNVHTDPRHPTYTDSVHLQVNVQGVNQINSVTCHVDTISLTIPMTLTDSLTYRTSQAIPPQPAYREIKFYFSAIDAQNDTAVSDTFSYRIGAVDLALDVEDIYLTGPRSIYLAARVENQGEITADSVVVQFFHGHPDSGGTQLGTVVLDSLPEHKTQEASLSWPQSLLPGQDYDIYVRVDPEGVFGETKLVHRKLWMGHYIVAQNGGTADTLWGGKLQFRIPTEAVSDTMVLQVSVTDSLELIGQPDLSFAQTDTAGQPQDSTAFRLIWADSTANPSLEKEMTLTLTYDTASVADTLDLRIYRWHEGNRRWVVLDSIQVEAALGQVTGRTSRLGTFTILANRDYTPPTIEITVEGQHFTSGDYVPPDPRFAIVVQDENGVDTESVQVALTPSVGGNTPVVPDSTPNANTVSISYSPELGPGEYGLMVTATDCNGNITPRMIYLTVAPEFDILSIGNYPNPFSDEVVETVDGVRARTIFTYELTQKAEELSLKVYTVSGRLVRSFEEYTSRDQYQHPGYHEIPWDGTDNKGEEIANGVYFWRIKAKGGGRTVQRTMKLAKIK